MDAFIAFLLSPIVVAMALYLVWLAVVIMELGSILLEWAREKVGGILQKKSP